MKRNSNQARVTIGLPVYNGQRYLAAALDSLLAQTFGDFELIICDNASTDGTEEICRSYAARDHRIRYVRHPVNLGAAKNYRMAFELSSSEYFRWATYDDLSGPDFLSRCLEVLDREPSVILAYPKTMLIDADGNPISKFEDNLHQSPRPSERFIEITEQTSLCNAIYGLARSSVLRRTGLTEDYVGSDILFLRELSLYGTLWEVPEFLFFRRIHAEAYSSRTDVREQMQFYKPENPSILSFREWHHLWQGLRSVWRAPIAFPEKVRLYVYLARSIVWNRVRLASELAAAVQHAFRAFKGHPARCR